MGGRLKALSFFSPRRRPTADSDTPTARRPTRDPAEIIRELEHLSKVERRLFQKSFARALVEQSHVSLYWSPSQRRIHARVAVGERKRPLPPDAAYVATYAHPFSTNDFLRDLNDLIERLEVERRNNAASALRAG